MSVRSSDYIDNSFKNDISDIIRVRDICPHISHVIIAKSNESISSAFKKMIDNGVLALPLYDDERSLYVAFIDVFDILAYIIETNGKDDIILAEGNIVRNDFISTPCYELPNRSLRNPWLIINENSSLQQAIDFMCTSGAVRLAVVDDTNNLSSILTQTRIIRHFSNKTHAMGRLSSLPIKKVMKFGSRDVIGIKDSEPAINAFMKIYDYNIGGVAIFNDYNEVIGNISINDLKDIGYNSEMFQKLRLKAKEFLNKKIEGADVPSLVWISKDNTIQDLLFKFRSHWIHRIYIIEPESRKTLGVISSTDIITLFSSTVSPVIQDK